MNDEDRKNIEGAIEIAEIATAIGAVEDLMAYAAVNGSDVIVPLSLVRKLCNYAADHHPRVDEAGREELRFLAQMLDTEHEDVGAAPLAYEAAAGTIKSAMEALQDHSERHPW